MVAGQLEWRPASPVMMLPSSIVAGGSCSRTKQTTFKNEMLFYHDSLSFCLIFKSSSIRNWCPAPLIPKNCLYLHLVHPLPLFSLTFMIILSVPDYVKPGSWCRLSRASNWGCYEGMGISNGEGEVSLWAIWDQGVRDRTTQKEGFQVSKRDWG
jgi:hypothetical protein